MMSKKTKNKILIIGILVFIFVMFSQLADAFHWWPDLKLWDQTYSKKTKEGVKELNISKFVGKASFLMYYTIQSNIISSIILISLYFIKNKQLQSRVFTIGCVYMILLFIGFWGFLAPVWIWNYLWWDLENIILHGVIPITFFVLWFKYSKAKINRKKTILLSLIFPVCYYFFALVFYIIIGGAAAIYPFLDFYNPFLLNLKSVVLIVLLNIAVFVFFTFITITFAFLAIQLKSWFHKRSSQLIKNTSK